MYGPGNNTSHCADESTKIRKTRVGSAGTSNKELQERKVQNCRTNALLIVFGADYMLPDPPRGHCEPCMACVCYNGIEQ